MDKLTPKEYLSLLDFCAALTAQRPTAKEIMSFNYTPVSLRPTKYAISPAYHMEGICHQRQGSDSDSDAQFKAEEARIDHQHDDNTR